MPQGIYENLLCGKGSEHPKFIPTEHQEETLKAFLKSPHRRMLLYHKLGSGKTCTSFLIAENLLKKKMVNHVYIFSPGSLRQGWLVEYCKVCGHSSENLEKNYTFITYNYAVGNRLPNLDGSLVIIDEVHNLMNGIKNKSVHPVKIYEKVKNSDCYVLALSGTPVYNSIKEFSFLGNLLKPNKFPEDLITFFNKDEKGVLTAKDPEKIRELFSGIISYYPGMAKYMPKIIENPPIKIVMTPPQEQNYWERDATEKKFQFPPNPAIQFSDPGRFAFLKAMYIIATKNIFTRSAGNFFYQENNLTPEERKRVRENKKSLEEVKPYPDLLEDQGGWITDETLKNGKLFKVFSTKFFALFVNILLNFYQKHVLFTFFKSKSGVVLIKTFLSMCGIRAEIFSGDLTDSQRRKLLLEFNSKENRYGGKIKILLVTEAGAEGISILEARHFHILESSPRVNKLKQAIGRIARYKSHDRLPPEERNVNVWRYWSISKDVTRKCIDEILYEKGRVQENEMESFLKIIQGNSVTSF